MHSHVSVVDFAVFAAYYAILKALILWAQTKFPESAFTRALAVLA